jgi:hypothetical protein
MRPAATRKLIATVLEPQLVSRLRTVSLLDALAIERAVDAGGRRA